MAKPINFDDSNIVLVADGCDDLPALKDETGFVTCWQLSSDEIARVLQSGVIVLHIAGQQHPPVSVEVLPPLDEIKSRKKG